MENLASLVCSSLDIVFIVHLRHKRNVGILTLIFQLSKKLMRYKVVL